MGDGRAFTVIYGSFDAFVEKHVIPGIESGAYDRADMIVIIGALRIWESDGTWNVAHG